jgi:hypothetical protein
MNKELLGNWEGYKMGLAYSKKDTTCFEIQVEYSSNEERDEAAKRVHEGLRGYGPYVGTALVLNIDQDKLLHIVLDYDVIKKTKEEMPDVLKTIMDELTEVLE